jgi:metal-dependent hydrolase (beta-lactamase superfamily II)
VIFKVAGCYGSELPGYHSAGFLVNGRLLLEAGTVTSILTWEEQLGVTEVLVSHMHLDHVKELAFLVDNRAGKTTRALIVTGVAEVVDGLKRHLFAISSGRTLPHTLAAARPWSTGHPRGVTPVSVSR